MRKCTDAHMVLDLSGPDGNAFVVMGTAAKQIKKELGAKAAEEYTEQATEGDYENLLRVTNAWITLVDSSDMYPHVLDEYEVETIVVRKK